jgi:hypothetical protein
MEAVEKLKHSAAKYLGSAKAAMAEGKWRQAGQLARFAARDLAEADALLERAEKARRDAAFANAEHGSLDDVAAAMALDVFAKL